MINLIIHIIEQGDTLYSLGKKYNVDYKQIALDNGLLLNDTLVIGQALVIINNTNKQKLGTIEVNGYTFASINNNLLESILPYLTYISIFSYHILPNGALKTINDQEIINKAIKQNVTPLMVITNISEKGKFDSELSHLILNNFSLQDTLINNILTSLKIKNYKGVNVDFEYVLPEDKIPYNNFLIKLKKVLEQNNYILITALAPKTKNNQIGLLYEAHDYKLHGQISDRVILMTYEWGYAYSKPMAIAPINNVEKVINYATKEIPSQKILMGIPNYGYNWQLPVIKGIRATSVNNVEAINIARDNNANIKYDNKSKSPYFNYVKDNKQHQVWFEDARSITEKLKLVNKYNLSGISYWTIDKLFPTNWTILSNMYNIKKLNN